MSLRAVVSALSPATGKVTAAYLLIATVANLVWEAAQLPLYTIWRTRRPEQLAYAVLHCTLGDLLVLSGTFLAALLMTAYPDWPRQGFRRVVLTATLLGAVYTTYSEWMNVEVLRRWAYAGSMPLLPPFGTGLAPFAQWVVIPPLSLYAARRLFV